MDLTNVTKIFANTPLVQGAKVTGNIPINGVEIPTQVAGSLSIQHNINEGSEIRLSFTTVPSYRINQLRQLFKEGSLHSYDNNQYIVTNYGETFDTQPLKQFGIISTYTVDIVLVVYSFLKAQVSVKIPFPSTGTPFISVHSIASASSVAYNGFDFQIPVSRDNADITFNFSLKNELDLRAFEFQHFIFYENNKVSTRPLSFSQPVVGAISPFQISGSPPTQYKNAIVTWANNTLSPFRNDPIYMNPTPSIVYLLEGDLDVTKCPDNITNFKDQKGQLIPNVGLNNPVSPKNIPLDNQSGTWYQATRALYLVFDNGGQTKELRITKKVDGVTEYTEYYKYGFMFTAYRLAQSGGTPQQYWQQIEYKKTIYNYTPVNTSFSQIRYQDRSGVWRSTIVSPELSVLLQKPRIAYLTSTLTTGWQYTRFQTEQQSGWDITKDTSIAGTIFWGKRVDGGIEGGVGGSTTAERAFCQDMLQLYIYRQIPISGKTQYHLVEAESIYNDTFINTNKEINANIEKVAWSQLPENLRNITVPDSEGFVGIARPDPDSYKEYLVISEQTEEISLAWRSNPLSKLYDPIQQIVAEKQPSLLANRLPKTYLPSLEPYVIGERSRTTIERKIIPNRNTSTKYNEVLQSNNRYKLPSGSSIQVPNYNPDSKNSGDRIDKYVEYTSFESDKGQGFQEKATLTTFSESEGRPPLATVKRTSVLQSDIQPDPFFKRDREYYYSCSLDNDFPVEDSTMSFSMLEIKQSELERTKNALDFRVQLENSINTQELTVDLGYYRPEYKVGSLTTLQEYDGQWLIRKVEHGFDFQSGFIVNKPTKLTLGKWYFVQSQITNSNFTQQPPNTLPYNPSKYNVFGSNYPLEFNKIPNTPSLVGERNSEEPSLAFIRF